MAGLAPAEVAAIVESRKIQPRAHGAGGKETPLTTANPLPAALTRRDDGVLIAWDNAGHRALYDARGLRLACPCAECVEEMSGRTLLDPARVPMDVRPLSIALVGAYGLRIQWSDGHGTGIYTFDRLRRSCPCARCAGTHPG